MIRVLLVLLALTTAATAEARPWAPPGAIDERPPPRHRLRGRVGQVPPAKREMLKQRVRALRAWTLTEELQLDDATAARLAPILARYDDAFARLMEQAVTLRRASDDAVARADDRAINRTIDDLLANQRARAQLEEQRFQELRRALTPAQAARLMVVLPEIDRRIHHKLRRVLEDRRRGRGGRPPGAPLDDVGPPDPP
jgi:hypothetical protein